MKQISIVLKTAMDPLPMIGEIKKLAMEKYSLREDDIDLHVKTVRVNR